MRIKILPICNELQLNLKMIFNSFHFSHFSRVTGPSVFLVISSSNIDDNKLKTRNAKNPEKKGRARGRIVSLFNEYHEWKKITNWQSAAHSIFGLLVDGKLTVHKNVCPCCVKCHACFDAAVSSYYETAWLFRICLTSLFYHNIMTWFVQIRFVWQI